MVWLSQIPKNPLKDALGGERRGLYSVTSLTRIGCFVKGRAQDINNVGCVALFMLEMRPLLDNSQKALLLARKCNAPVNPTAAALLRRPHSSP